MRIRPKTAGLIAILAAVLGFVAVDAAKDEPAADAQPASAARDPVLAAEGSAPASPAEAAPAEQGGFVVPERPGFTTSGGSPMFESQTWQPPPPPPQKQAKPAPPPPPTAPPVPYTFVGRLIHDGELSLLLAKGDTVIPIREGQTIDGAYRVESITDRQITLVYLPLNERQTIPVVTALEAAPPVAVPGAPGALPWSPGGPPLRAAPPPVPTTSVVTPQDPAAPDSPATVAWTGPHQVKLGTPFELTLRVNSSQPLHAWPMQLRVDPERFEVLTVRPGKLAGGPNPNFSYRMNPDGTIFVGASVQQPASAPSNAEILALTLRPVKAAPAAEVSISSLNLQGASGRPIPHAQLASFRTTIAP